MRNSGIGLETLGRAECLVLMATVPVGRVVFTDRALPAIQPVNFVLDGSGDVIFRTGPGPKLAAALRGAIVAFETDDLDLVRSRGWYVTVIGRARHITDPAEIARLRHLPLEAWAPGPHEHLIRLVPRLVSGHRLITSANNEGDPARPAGAGRAGSGSGGT